MQLAVLLEKEAVRMSMFMRSCISRCQTRASQLVRPRAVELRSAVCPAITLQLNLLLCFVFPYMSRVCSRGVRAVVSVCGGVGGSEELSHLVCSGLEPEIAISSSGFVKPACLDMFVRFPTL